MPCDSTAASFQLPTTLATAAADELADADGLSLDADALADALDELADATEPDAFEPPHADNAKHNAIAQATRETNLMFFMFVPSPVIEKTLTET